MTEEQETLSSGLRKDEERALKLLAYDDRLVLVYYLRKLATRGASKYDNYGAGLMAAARSALKIIDELGGDSGVEVRRTVDSGQ